MFSSKQEPLDPTSRPLPASATIAVAGLSAALVIAGGVLVAERVEPRRSAAPLAATPLPSLALPVEEKARAPGSAAAPVVAAATIAPAAPIVSAATIAAAAPVATAAPVAAAAPIATAAPVATAAVDPGDPASLAPDRGYLVLVGAAGASAYVNGAEVGAVDQRLAVPCGARYVRLGTPRVKGREISWLTPGRSVVVACRGETRVDLAR